jgi:hypothetical protein
MAVKDSFIKLQKVQIDDLLPSGAGFFVYEGCSVLLSDGRPCALGKHKQRLQRQDPQSPMGLHARGRSSHECCADGAGQYMFRFAIQIGDEVMQVYKDNGIKLMGMSGQKFWDNIQSDVAKVDSICDEVRSVLWTICYVKDPREGCRVVSVLRHNVVKQEVKSDGSGKSVVQKFCDAAVELTGDIVGSMKSIRIKSNE